MNQTRTGMGLETPEGSPFGFAPKPYDLDDLLGIEPKQREDAFREANAREAMFRQFLWDNGIFATALTPGDSHPFTFRNGKKVNLGFGSHQLDIQVGCYRGEIKAFNVPMFKRPGDYKYTNVLLDDLDGISKKVLPPDFYVILSQQTTPEDLRNGHGAMLVPVRYCQHHNYLSVMDVYASNDRKVKPSRACPRKYCLGVAETLDLLRCWECQSPDDKNYLDTLAAMSVTRFIAPEW